LVDNDEVAEAYCTSAATNMRGVIVNVVRAGGHQLAHGSALDPVQRHFGSTPSCGVSPSRAWSDTVFFVRRRNRRRRQTPCRTIDAAVPGCRPRGRAELVTADRNPHGIGDLKDAAQELVVREYSTWNTSRSQLDAEGAERLDSRWLSLSVV
jgi:hypothetical protein